MSATESIKSGRFKAAMMVYPGMTLLDFAGPQAAWCFHGDTYVVWKDLDPIISDSGVTVQPTHDFESCPRNVDVLFVPGGAGVFELINDEAVLRFLREQAHSAKFVTSVCVGSILLAAAGLLEGRSAACHWASYPVLEELGVKGVRERVVFDGNIISGGGVTAGIDFGLTILEKLRGEDAAKTAQLMMEYDPAPPFAAGTPAQAGEAIMANVATLLGDVDQQPIMAAVGEAKQRLAAAAEHRSRAA